MAQRKPQRSVRPAPSAALPMPQTPPAGATIDWFPLWAQPLWRALVWDAGVGVVLVDVARGNVLYANQFASRALGGAESDTWSNRALASCVSPAVAAEWMRCAQQVLESGHALVCRTRHTGRPMLVTVRGVTLADAPGVSAVLFTLRRLASDHEPDRCDPGADHVPSTSATLGELDGLTPQQLVVLRLIGEGLSTDQIAARLYRTPKTIEWHRMSLGRKLGVRSRAELVLIAVRNGLVSPDEIVLHREPPEDRLDQAHPDQRHDHGPEPDEPPERLDDGRPTRR